MCSCKRNASSWSRVLVGTGVIFVLAAAVGDGGVAVAAPQEKPQRVLTRHAPAEQGGLSDVLSTRLKAVFRIDLRLGNRSTGRGTAFAVHAFGRRLVLATCAHLVEDSDGDILPRQLLYAVCSGSGPEFRVRRITRHRDRKKGKGPDVAILELHVDDSDALPPEVFQLLPKGHRQSLLGQRISLLGFPSITGIPSSVPFLGSGQVAVDPKDREQLVYAVTADHGASGSPIFMVNRKVRNSGKTTVGYVLAVHTHRLDKDNLRGGVHVRRLWEILQQQGIENRSPQPAQFSIHPTLPVVPEGELARIVASAKTGRTQEALQQLEPLIAGCLREQRSVPWEFYCLQGALFTHEGFALERKHQHTRAKQRYRLAYSALSQAVLAAPGRLLPRLLLIRAANYLARPDAARCRTLLLQPAAPWNRQLLKWSHDQLSGQLNDSTLSARERAQCFYLLAFTHRYLPCGGWQKTHRELLQSMTLYRSRQADSWLRQFHGVPASSTQPNLWEEFSAVLREWKQRTAAGNG